MNDHPLNEFKALATCILLIACFYVLVLGIILYLW